MRVVKAALKRLEGVSSTIRSVIALSELSNNEERHSLAFVIGKGVSCLLARYSY